MIKNLILDMGNVLIEFRPERFIDDLGVSDPEIRALFLREIFRSSEWMALDHGDMTEAEALERICARLPENLWPMAEHLVFHWNEPLHPIPGMAELVRDCKAAGMGVYLLSNASARHKEYWPYVPGSEYFDGLVVSANLKMVKPDPEIYLHVLRTFGLKANECLFVDDMLYNVTGAEAVGIPGFHFQNNAADLRQRLFHT